jgi:hypothetical protein
MQSLRTWGLAGLVLAAVAWPAQAGVYVGVRVGGPYYYRPVYVGGYYYRPYYPVYVAVPPVAVSVAAPVVVQPAPAAAAAVVTTPGPAGADVAVTSTPPVPAEPATRPAAPPRRGAQIDAELEQLGSQDPRARAEAAVQLGRLKAHRAVTSLTRMLREDASPQAREAAARALGLIGEAGSLTALQKAAQADNDRDVRHSAAFAAEVIRGRAAR